MFTMPRALPSQVTGPVVAVLARLGVTPNMLTTAQLLGGIGAAVLIAEGELAWGGVAILAAAALDAFDGTLARTTGRVTRFGGVFDSTVDRLFEAVVFGGLLWYYLELGQREPLMPLQAGSMELGGKGNHDVLFASARQCDAIVLPYYAGQRRNRPRTGLFSIPALPPTS